MDTEIKELVIKDRIRELMSTYVRFADEKKATRLAELFTDEGSFTPLNVAGEPLLEMRGHQEIAETISKSLEGAIAIHHLFSNEINIHSDNQATGVFSMEDYVIYEEGSSTNSSTSNIDKGFKSMHGFGHYHADFVKIESEWRIEKLVLTRIKLDFTY